jgi:calcium/proton exchanger cax
MIFLFLITIIIGFHTKFFIESIDSFTVKVYISDGFVDLILILIIRNAAEYITIVIEVFRDKVNLVIEIIFEFDVQIAIFLLSVIILIDWIIDITNMILLFDDLQYYNLFIFLLILFPILLTADICKLENDLFTDNELRIIDRFSDISFLFLYSVVAIIAFFFIYLILIAIDRLTLFLKIIKIEKVLTLIIY